MKPLSDTLQAMKLPEATPKDAPRGLTTIDGPTTIQILPALRVMGRQMEAGKPISDRDLQALLLQHFGLSRLKIKEKTTIAYSEPQNNGGCDFISNGFEISLDRLGDDELAIYDALQFFSQPADVIFVARHMGMLRVSMARKNESEEDITILIGLYADILQGYPRDIVSGITKEWIATKKWFPLASELREACDSAVRFRKTMMDALETCRNPLLAAKAQAKRIARAEAATDWKNTPREKWDTHMWNAYVSDAEAMHKLALDNPQFMDAAGWVVEIERRKGLIPAAMVSPASGNEEAAGVVA